MNPPFVIASVCIQLAGVVCPPGSGRFPPQFSGSVLLDAIIWAVGAGVAFFSALACFFWAAHLRTLDALRALAGAQKP